MAETGHSGTFSLSPLLPPLLLRLIKDWVLCVMWQRSAVRMNWLRMRAFESWHRATFLQHLKIVTVGFFQVCFSHWMTLGHPLLVFLETWVITRHPLPLSFSFIFFFFIESLFNLVKKIGLAWERQNSLGIGSVVLELCTLFCCCFFFPCRKKKFQFVPKPHEIQIKRSWVRVRPQHHDKDMGCLSKELYKWRSPGEKEMRRGGDST